MCHIAFQAPFLRCKKTPFDGPTQQYRHVLVGLQMGHSIQSVAVSEVELKVRSSVKVGGNKLLI